jgi:hypothetical protein
MKARIKIDDIFIRFYRLITFPFFVIYIIIYLLSTEELRNKFLIVSRNFMQKGKDGLDNNYYEIVGIVYEKIVVLNNKLYMDIFYFCLLILLFIGLI